jgi:CubicO group peptidase (beta-lactamase class C family)
MQGFVDEGKIAGILTLVARRGQVVHCESLGVRDIETALPVQEDTIFRIYSMTKPIISTAVMLLYDEGRFQLNDPIVRFLPEFRNVQVAGSGADGNVVRVTPTHPITILELLTHTAGLTHGFDRNNEVDRLFHERITPLVASSGKTALQAYVGAVASLPLHHQPGLFFHYSVATDVLGYLVEVVAGVPLGIFLRERIFEPLGMVDTDFFVPERKLARFASLYATVEAGAPGQGRLKNVDPVATSNYRREDRVQLGGGSLVSTAPDYLRFCQMILNGGALDGVRLLNSNTVDLMRMNHLPEGQYLDDRQARGFGLGGYVLLDPARSAESGSVGNWGWFGSANTFFWIDFKEQLIAILMTQHQRYQPDLESIFRDLVYQALI